MLSALCGSRLHFYLRISGLKTRVIGRLTSPEIYDSGIMTGRELDDCLPPGWTVKVKVRKDGKKDKYYFDPSKEFKFKSRQEVFRHINTGQIGHPKTMPRGGAIKPSAKNVSIEKAVAKGLPSGWVKEIRVKKSKNKIRKDSYYTDPTGRYVFRSLKGVLRYVKSGKLERNAFKPRDLKESAIESEGSKILTPAESNKDILAIDKARRRIIWETKVLDPRNEIKENEDIIKSSCTEECTPALSNDGCKTLEVNSSKQLLIGESSFSKTVFVSSTKDRILSVSDMQSPDGETGNHETKNAEVSSRKPRKRKEMNLPRRTSKRLAGLKADPISELKVRNGVHRILDKKNGEKIVDSPERLIKQEPVVEKENGKQVINSTGSSSNHETRSQIQESCGSSKNHIGGNSKILDENATKERFETEIKAEKKPEPAVGLPLEELLTDPCIAFAIKTLTADEVHPPDNLAAGKEKAAACGAEITADEKEVSSFVLPSSSSPLSKDGKFETNEKANEIIDLSLNPPLGEIWADPCIEFAIKTLIGDIPIENNLKNAVKAKPVNALVGDGQSLTRDEGKEKH